MINALRCLPGVGPKSAQRMAFHLLERARDDGLNLGQILKQALTEIRQCTQCRIFCETEICNLCSSTNRDSAILCIVESPIDVLAIEQTASFRGYYFVLMGHLSPIDGISPQDIGIDDLLERLAHSPVQEIILATNPTVEGEATAHYIVNLLKNRKIKFTRIAHGVPLGGELEYLDGGTLARALLRRTLVEEEA